MSGPLTKNEIEDVVSSVRRLVSPEGRQRPVSRDLGLDKLILTPAQRVVAEMAGTGSVMAGGEGQGPIAPKRPRPHRPISRPLDRVDPVRKAPVDDRDTTARRDAAPSLAELALQAEEAEVVTESSPATPVAEPQVAAPDAVPPAAAKAAPKPKARTASAKPRAKPAKPAGARKPAPLPAATDLLVGAAAQVLTDQDGNPVSLLDEDDLIQMVRRVLREELKGELGEKITRNVRKLVRAEINRILTEQTLE